MKVFKNKLHLDVKPITSIHLLKIKTKKLEGGVRMTQGEIVDLAIKTLHNQLFGIKDEKVLSKEDQEYLEDHEV